MQKLYGKSCLITGTNRGLGKAIMEEFAKEGANIYAHARRETSEFVSLTEEVASKCGVSITPVYFDMTDYSAMKTAIMDIMKRRESVDVLVNSAGIAHGGFLQSTPLGIIKDVFEVNFFSVISLSQLIVKLMTRNKTKGAIVNIASIAGLDLNQGNCAYGLSKASVIALTKLMAKEYTRGGIRVTAVAPGLIDTGMARQMEVKAGKAMVEDSLMKRLGRPEEVARLVAFLASDEASFISGEIVRIDGGKV
ncbi:MAG: SDR family oxidoreductase [Selenomonadaceae bacterium]|nr:SDR family oxidoreductase [Selenomonadaceae bacterium]